MQSDVKSPQIFKLKNTEVEKLLKRQFTTKKMNLILKKTSLIIFFLELSNCRKNAQKHSRFYRMSRGRGSEDIVPPVEPLRG